MLFDLKVTMFKNKWIVLTVIAVLLAAVIALATALIITSSSHQQALQAAAQDGEATGKQIALEEQGEVVAADKNEAMVPNYVDMNITNFVRLGGLSGDTFVEIDENVNLPIMFITPDGEAIDEDNAAYYKVVSQDPVAGTVFDVTYGEGGYFVDQTGIKSVTVTLERVEQD